MKDKELKLEDIEDPQTLGGASYILFMYIDLAKRDKRLAEVELRKRALALSPSAAASEVSMLLSSPWKCIACQQNSSEEIGGIGKRQDLVRKRYINCSRLTPIGDTLIITEGCTTIGR